MSREHLREREKKLKMNKQSFLEYFQQKATCSKDTTEINITKIVSSATKNVTNAELTLVEKEIENSVNRPRKYEKDIPKKIKQEVGIYADSYGTAAALKKFKLKYSKFTFNRTTVNSWKNKFKGGVNSATFKKAGRPNLLNENLLKKVKDIAIGTRSAGGVINRKQILNIAKGVVKANNPNTLNEFGGPIELTDRWARNVLDSMEWVKRKGTTGKVEPSKQFLDEEKFTFQRQIAYAVFEHDIPESLVLNLDQTPLSYVSPGKYTFSFKGVKNVPIKDVDDKRQITGTFAVSLDGKFLPMQLIYQGKTKRSLPKFEFPKSFSVTFTKNHWSNTDKSVEFFENIIFPFLKRTKQEKGYPEEQYSLIIMDTFKGQDNDTLKKLCSKNHCEVVIVPHNLTNKFQPLDISVNKAAKAFIQNKYNEWFSDEVSIQLRRGIDPSDIKISSKLSDLKPLHGSWIVDLYKHLSENKEMIINGFDSAGISEAVKTASTILEKVENPFRE